MKKKRNTKNQQHTITCFQENRIYIYFYSHHFSVSRFVSLPRSQRTRCVQLYICSIYSTISHCTSRSTEGSATFLEPCPQYWCFFIWKISEGSLVWSWIKNGACACLLNDAVQMRGYRHFSEMNAHGTQQIIINGIDMIVMSRGITGIDFRAIKI